MNKEEYVTASNDFAYRDDVSKNYLQWLLEGAVRRRFKLLNSEIKEILNSEDWSDSHSMKEMKEKLVACSDHLNWFKHQFDQIEKL